MTTLPLPADRSAASLCSSCNADGFACDIKTNLGGKRCCLACSHFPPTDRTEETTR